VRYLVTVGAIAFALPAARSKPHAVPVGVAGPQAAAGQVTDQLERKAPGAFAVTTYDDAAILRAAIENREVYGGIAVGAPAGRSEATGESTQGPMLLTATGGSPMIAQLLTQIGDGMSQQGVQLRTEDLAPPTTSDPRGAGIAASALPITWPACCPRSCSSSP
jgi:hypothetical protein